MSNPAKPRFVVTLEALPLIRDYETDHAGYRRLRAFLKCALRTWGLRCVSLSGEPEKATGESSALDDLP